MHNNISCLFPLVLGWNLTLDTGFVGFRILSFRDHARTINCLKFNPTLGNSGPSQQQQKTSINASPTRQMKLRFFVITSHMADSYIHWVLFFQMLLFHLRAEHKFHPLLFYCSLSVMHFTCCVIIEFAWSRMCYHILLWNICSRPLFLFSLIRSTWINSRCSLAHRANKNVEQVPLSKDVIWGERHFGYNIKNILISWS